MNDHLQRVNVIIYVKNFPQNVKGLLITNVRLLQNRSYVCLLPYK